MAELKIGDDLIIHCYKHNGKVHRTWEEALVLDVNDDYIVCANNRTIVTEAQGSMWKTKEPAVMYFFKKEWFNVIVQFKKDGIYYYCNIASPYLIDADTIKYIDYDLDLRIFPNKSYKVLDRIEYEHHKKYMNYSDELDIIINYSLNELIRKYKNKHFSFIDEENEKYLIKYKKLRNKK